MIYLLRKLYLNTLQLGLIRFLISENILTLGMCRTLHLNQT